MWLLDGIKPYAAPYDFLILWAVLYIWTAALYFIIGFIVERLGKSVRNLEIPALNGMERTGWRTIQNDRLHSMKCIIMTAFCTAGGLYAQYRGWAMAPAELSVWTVVWTFAAATVLFDIWFYFSHRLMHTKYLLRWHKDHHRNRTPTTWTNDHFSLPDAFSTQCFFIIMPFLIPIPPLVFVGWRLFDQARGMVGHSGYEFFDNRMARWPSPLIAVLHHDMHHQRFNVNFALQFSLWDRMFGTLDPDYDRLVAEMAADRRAGREPRARVGRAADGGADANGREADVAVRSH